MAKAKTGVQGKTTAGAPNEHAARARKPVAIGRKLERANAALKKQFDKVRARIAGLRTRGSEAFDELYEAVGDLLDSNPPLYLGGGYRTKEDFIAGELPGETLRSVVRNVLVARCFSPEDEARHGISFLEEVALYAKELAAADEPPRAIHLDRLMIASRGKGGTVVRKKARDATVLEVRAARRAMRKGGATKRDASPTETALRALLGKHKHLREVAVRASAKAASFGGVPIEAIAAFGKALASAKLPAAEPG